MVAQQHVDARQLPPDSELAQQSQSVQVERRLQGSASYIVENHCKQQAGVPPADSIINTPQVLGPLLSAGQADTGDVAAAFAAAAAILAAVGRPATKSGSVGFKSAAVGSASSGAGSRHLDERLAEAALCAIGIALTASESPAAVSDLSTSFSLTSSALRRRQLCFTVSC